MKISQAGERAIEHREGVVLKVYADSAGYLTAGMGHKLAANTTLKLGDAITQAQCDQWSLIDLQTAEDAVNRLVTVPLNQNQFDALCSFVFNVGVEDFETSMLLKLLNAGNYKGAQAEFARWHYKHVNGVKEPDQGLLNRRMEEALQFGTPVAAVPSAVDPNAAAPAPVVVDSKPAVAAPPAKVQQTTTGKLQIGALISGGVAAVIQGVQQAQPALQGIQGFNGAISGLPGWLKLISGVLVLGCVGACAATLWHKHKSLTS